MSDQVETPQADPDPPRQFSRKPILIGLAILATVLVIWAFGGRRYKTAPSAGSTGPDRASRSTWIEELLPIAMDKFDRLDEFVEPEMLNQAIDQLDQWIQGQKPLEGWQVDPMIAAQPMLSLSVPELKNLDKLSFSRDDSVPLQEAVMLRDLSNWARGEQVDDLARAKQLFDWTVRNVQIEPQGSPIQQRPWDTLILGAGTIIDRAWLFILLCRQQGLDAVMLAIYDPNDPTKQKFLQWAPAVLIEQHLYPFMVDLGFPIPAPGGVKRNEAGQLEIQPATLSQIASDDALLRQLDMDAAHPCPLKASSLKEVVALVEASPAYLSQRLKLLESRLAGKDKLVLTTSPSALAVRLKNCKHVAEVRLWHVPYQYSEMMQRMNPRDIADIVDWQRGLLMPYYAGRTQALMRGRILHLKGEFTGEPNAAEMYQLARPSDREMDVAPMDPLIRRLYGIAKVHASYFLGLLAMEQKNYPAAIDYFAKRTLEATPGGPWTHGAKYNLGRVYEAMGQREKAIQEYESDVTSPCLIGNLLRSRWLGSKTAKLPPQLSAPPQPPSSAQPPAKPSPTKPAMPPEKKDGKGKDAAPEKPSPKRATDAKKNP